jgi:hypothetical protein
MTEDELVKEIADAAFIVKEKKLQFRRCREEMDAIETVLIGAKLKFDEYSKQLAELQSTKWINGPDPKAWDDERFITVYNELIKEIK